MVSTLPDAAPRNWVDRFAPAPIRPWLRLARLDRPTGIWLLMLPGWQGIALATQPGHWPDLKLLALFFTGAVLMRSAGCAFNDIVDRDLDAKVARTARRPIPAGEVSVRGAAIFVAACCAISFLILISFNWLAVILGGASLLLVVAYPFMKRITWWPQAWLGLTFNWGALLGFAAAGGFSKRVLPGVLLYASGLFWTLGYDTIYAIQDLEDDALAGVKSSARRLGRAAPLAVGGFYAASVVCVLLLYARAPFGALPLAPFALQLIWQVSRLQIDDPSRALLLFKSNTLAGALLFGALTLKARFG